MTVKNISEKFKGIEENLDSVEENDMEQILELALLGAELYKEHNKKIFKRGLVMGALSAVAIQSVITIFMLI